MTNSTDFWRQIDSRIDEKLSKLLQPTGITPGVWNGITFDRYGIARFAQTAAGGGSHMFTLHRRNGQSFTSGAAEAVIEFTTTLYDPNTRVTFAPWKMTAPFEGHYAYTIFLRFDSATWTAGNNMRIFQDLQSSPDDYRQMRFQIIPATFTDAHDIICSGAVHMAANDTLSFLFYHNRSGGSVTISDGVVSIVGVST